MAKTVSIIMYHYVRDLQYSRYPEIKGLSTAAFRKQIDYILKNYTPITMQELMTAFSTPNHNVPDNSILLTFDDGYIDHFINVFPLLNDQGIQGSFFPSIRAVIEHKLLDVNKIHFILAAAPDKNIIVTDIFRILDELRADCLLQTNEYYYQKLAQASRFDSKEVIFIKRLLQKELPDNVRQIIIDRLFNTYIHLSETVFAHELYMSADQLKCLRKNGMFIGCHGYDHLWLNTLDQQSQRDEIQLSLSFLESDGITSQNWVMCYPYGAYNDSLLALLKEKQCKIGLTTRVGIANLVTDNCLTLPRLDANDLPLH